MGDELAGRGAVSHCHICLCHSSMLWTLSQTPRRLARGARPRKGSLVTATYPWPRHHWKEREEESSSCQSKKVFLLKWHTVFDSGLIQQFPILPFSLFYLNAGTPLVMPWSLRVEFMAWQQCVGYSCSLILQFPGLSSLYPWHIVHVLSRAGKLEVMRKDGVLEV